MVTSTGFITLSPMDLTPPICSPGLEPGWNLPLLSPLPIPSVLVTPMVSPVPSMEENIHTGLLPLKLGPLLDANVQQSPSLTQFFLDGSIFADEDSIVSIAEKSLTKDLTSCDVIPVVPQLKSNPLVQSDTCLTSSSTCNERPLSPRSRMRQWAMKHPLKQVGLESECPETVAVPQKGSKMSPSMAKNRYSALLMELKVVNSQQYEEHLRRNDELRQLERVVQPNQIESLKKLIFRQNFLQRSAIYEQKFQMLGDSSVPNLPSLRGGWLSLLDHLANRNGISRELLIVSLQKWLSNVNGKKKGLILIGRSDSGKTFLADCLLSVFEKSDVGYFQCPMGNTVSSFMYADLLNKEAYRCDEFILEQAGVLQSFKQLTEGSSTLQTDVKYKDSTHVDPKPVIVTMNGDCREDVVKWFSSEFVAVSNRCVILLMDTPLRDLYTNKQLDQLRPGSQVLLRILFTSYIEVVDESEKSLSEYANYI